MATGASVLLAPLGLALIGNAYEVQDQIKSQALTLLRSRRKNTGFFEESRDDDFQRECVDELCSAEELREIFPTNEIERSLKWAQLTRQCYLDDKKCNAEGTQVCVQTWNSRTCKCKEGFDGDRCDEDIDECKLENSCPSNSICSNNHGSYSCSCEFGYSRSSDEKDFTCEKEEIVCGENQINENGFCNCLSGYQRDPNSNNCVDIDECELGYCNDEPNTYCSNTIGDYVCNCETGYEKIGESCQDIDECSDPEKADSCGNGFCKNIPGGFQCECNEGYELGAADTCVNIDECKDGNPCLANEVCFDTDGHYFCCPAGFSFVDGNCVNIACADVECGENQSCRDGICYCDNIYQEVVDGTCVDVDECSQGIHTCDLSNPGQVCKNLDSSGYECICEDGYVMIDDVCINPIDDIGFGASGAGPIDGPTSKPTEKAETTAKPTESIATTETHTYCPPGFEMAVVDRSGREGCVDVDECQTNNGGCKHPNGMCLNYYGSNFCYGQLEQEKVICHHYHVDDPESDLGYACKCYDGYSLCHDEITCVADERMYFSSDNSAECSDGQVSYLGVCYRLSEGTANYEDASSDCESLGGSLAIVNSRKVWWWLGSMVDQGTKPFYINSGSDYGISGANIHVVNDGGDKLLVNIVPSMNAVPPQWNAVSGSEAHRYWCQF